MAVTEKNWLAVAVQLFTSNGSSSGLVTIPSTFGYHAKQKVIIQATAQPDLTEIEVKRVLNKTQLLVGPKGARMDVYSDLTAYTTAANAKIYAPQQPRRDIPYLEEWRSVYEEEPACAVRVFGVDYLGNPYTVDNPLPVQLSDGSINIETLNANLMVQLSAKDNDPNAGDVHDSIRIGDGDYELKVNPDGSINTISNVASTIVTTPTITNFNAVLANTEYSYTFPTSTKRFLIRVRGGLSQMKIAFNPGDTSTSYLSIGLGSFYSEDNMVTSAGFKIYFQVLQAGQIVEVLSWV